MNNRNIAFYQSPEWYRLRDKVIRTYKHGACAFCGKPFMANGQLLKVTVDHIQPLNKRPDLGLVFSNLQLLHSACNTRKGYWIDRNKKPVTNEDGFNPEWQ